MSNETYEYDIAISYAGEDRSLNSTPSSRQLLAQNKIKLRCHTKSSENRATPEFFFIFGGVPLAYEVCCVMVHSRKAQKLGLDWL